MVAPEDTAGEPAVATTPRFVHGTSRRIVGSQLAINKGSGTCWPPVTAPEQCTPGVEPDDGYM
jgi:hypothetical protein